MKQIKYIRSFAFLLLTIIFYLAPNDLMAQKKYSFCGKLGKNITFRLDLEQNQDSIIAGETTYYRKNGKVAKIPVYGWLMSAARQGYWNGDVLSLKEFNGNKECGNFMIALQPNGDVAEGRWYNSSKEFDINSVENTVFPAEVTFFHPAKGAAISGIYSFIEPSEGEPHGGHCELTYQNNKVHYQISVSNPNIAETEKTALLKGSYFTGAQDDYKFKAYIDRKFVVIWTTQNAQVDEWGAWSVLDGFFIRL